MASHPRFARAMIAAALAAAPAAAQDCGPAFLGSAGAAAATYGAYLAARIPDDQDIISIVRDYGFASSLQYHYVAARDAYLRADADSLAALEAGLQRRLDAHPDGDWLAPFVLERVNVVLAEPTFLPVDRAVLETLTRMPELGHSIDWAWSRSGVDPPSHDWRGVRWMALTALSEHGYGGEHAARAAEEIGDLLREGIPPDHHGYQVLKAGQYSLLRLRALVAARAAGEAVDDAAFESIFDELSNASLECAPLGFGMLSYYRAQMLRLAAEQAARNSENGQALSAALTANTQASRGLRYELAPVLWGLNQMERMRILSLRHGLLPDPVMPGDLDPRNEVACEIRQIADLLDASFGDRAPRDFLAAYRNYCSPE